MDNILKNMIVLAFLLMNSDTLMGLSDTLKSLGVANAVGAGDQLQIQRLKKRKLVLRDRLSFVEDQLTPDIIA